MQFSLRKTLFLSLALALVAILSVQILIRYLVVLPKLEAQAHLIDKKDLERVKSSTDAAFTSLGDIVYDNAVWEEMTDRMAVEDVEFLDYTYDDPGYYEQLNLNGIYFYNKKGDLVWGLGLDDDLEVIAVPGLEQPTQRLREAIQITADELGAGAPRPIRKQGLLYLNNEPAMFVSVSISLPNRPETYQGTLTFFRFLDKRQLAELEAAVRHPIKAQRIEAEGDFRPEDVVEAKDVYSDQTPISRHNGELTILFRDIDNAPFVTLSFKAQPPVYDDALLNASLAAEISTAVVALLLFYIYLNRSTIRPIQHLSRVIERVAATGNYRQTTRLEANNELGLLSRQLDNMLATIESQRQELASHNLKLQTLSDTDQLTGLANRRFLQSTTSQMENNPHCRQVPISLLMIDIDQFKQYNDQHGHSAGDRTLCTVAQILKGHTHLASDLLARYGGEEFLLLLPETDAEGALAVAENLLAAIREEAIPHQSSTVADHLTVSIGLATKPANESFRYSTLFEQADSALYQAKEDGRDQVVIADELIPDRLAR